MLTLVTVLETSASSTVDMLAGWLAASPMRGAGACVDRLARAREGVPSPDMELFAAIGECDSVRLHLVADWLRHGYLGPVLDTSTLWLLRRALADEVDMIHGAIWAGFNYAPHEDLPAWDD